MHIYHTGRNNDDLRVHGTVKGVAQIGVFTPSNEPLTDSVFGPIIKPLPNPDKVKPGLLKGLYMLILVPLIIVLLPFVLPFLLIDKLLLPMRKKQSPREFRLFD
jgi:hypothetical protein